MSGALRELEVVVDRLAADGVDVDPAVAEPLTLRLGARELRAGEGLEVTGDLPSVPRAPWAIAADLERAARLIELLDEVEG